VKDGGLSEPYILAQFHMHWGKDNCEGSEHTANGLHYPLEIHLVHYNSKYPNISAALRHEDGLAVLGIMADTGPTAHRTIDSLEEQFHSVKYAATTTEIKAPLFSMQSLLPSDTDHFVRYRGSLTTPPCLEIVTWTVFKTPIPVSESQMNAFRALSLNKPAADTSVNVTDMPMDVNFRPTLPLNGRIVSKNFDGSFKPTRKTCDARPVQEIPVVCASGGNKAITHKGKAKTSTRRGKAKPKGWIR
jgi:carbonic anhydrase